MPLDEEAGFDIADSVCAYPMTRCRLEVEIRRTFGDCITIWGGIPSILLCPDETSSDELKRFIDDLIERYGHQSPFVLGVSDMVTLMPSGRACSTLPIRWQAILDQPAVHKSSKQLI